MSQSGKTNQFDELLNQIDQKDGKKGKRRIFLVLGLLLLGAASFIGYTQFTSGDANNGLASNVPASVNVNTSPQPVQGANDFNTTPSDELEEEVLTEEIEEEDAQPDAKNAESAADDKKKRENKKSDASDNKEANTPANNARAGISNQSFTADEIANIPIAATFNSDGSPKETKPASANSNNNAANTATAKVAEEPKVAEEAPTGNPVAEETPEIKAEETPEEVAEEAKPTPEVAAPTAPTGVTRRPSYPGGESEMRKFFARRISYPQRAIDKKVEGNVSVRVKVDEAGKIVESTVIQGIGEGCDKEVLRAINRMKKWEPAMNNGVEVSQYYVLSVAFRLPE